MVVDAVNARHAKIARLFLLRVNQEKILDVDVDVEEGVELVPVRATENRVVANANAAAVQLVLVNNVEVARYDTL